MCRARGSPGLELRTTEVDHLKFILKACMSQQLPSKIGRLTESPGSPPGSLPVRPVLMPGKWP